MKLWYHEFKPESNKETNTMRKLVYLFVLIFSACSQQVWEKTPNGVIIHPESNAENGAKTISLQV